MPVVLPPQLTSKTVAVNAMLRSIGEAPVQSLEETTSVDAATALGALDEHHLAVLSEGWHWNREYDLTLTPEADNTIPLPSTCLFVGAAYWGGDKTTPAKVTERGRKLYDIEGHSYSFSDPVTVDMVLYLEWEEIPEYARRYITMRALQQFQGDVQSSNVIFQIKQSEVEMARAVLEQREAEANPDNQITGNIQQISRLHGRNLRRRP